MNIPPQKLLVCGLFTAIGCSPITGKRKRAAIVAKTFQLSAQKVYVPIIGQDLILPQRVGLDFGSIFDLSKKKAEH